jgi:hypothetical protein
LARPVDGDDAKAVLERRLERCEVSTSVPDGMKTHDHGLRARDIAVVDGERHSVDHDEPTRLRHGEREAAGRRGFELGARLSDRGTARRNPRPDVPPADVHHRLFGVNRPRRVSGRLRPVPEPEDLQNDPGRLSRETPRLWRRAGRAARSERDRAQPRVLTR